LSSSQSLLARVGPGARSFDILHTTLYRLHQRVAKQFRVGRAFLAGDAAHINNPLGGMGMNGGVHDAVNLTSRPAAVYSGQVADDDLDRYDAQRRLVRPMASPYRSRGATSRSRRCSGRPKMLRTAGTNSFSDVIGRKISHGYDILSLPIAGRGRPMNQITRLRKDRAAEPVLAESLKDQAYEAIKHRIITCAFKPGRELSESALAGLLKIGRTPVHQAFDRLNTEGPVDVQPRKGVVVRPISLDEVIEIIETRLLNEAFAVRLAVERLYPTIRTALLSTSIALVPSASVFQYLLPLLAPRQGRFPQDQNDKLRLPTEIRFS
jgi:DNA-binding transcriptional regulator YhcF (GntR family)